MLRRVATPAWSAIGSPGFMAPEQIRDARTASHAADLYGLGTTWYACLSGMLPFSGANPHKVMQQALGAEIVPVSAHVPATPRAVCAALAWLLQKEPRKRPESATAVVRLLERVLDAPDDAHAVDALRAAHDGRRRREDTANAATHALALSAGVLAFAWLVWLTLTLDAEPGEITL